MLCTACGNTSNVLIVWLVAHEVYGKAGYVTCWFQVHHKCIAANFVAVHVQTTETRGSTAALELQSRSFVVVSAGLCMHPIRHALLRPVEKAGTGWRHAQQLCELCTAVASTLQRCPCLKDVLNLSHCTVFRTISHLFTNDLAKTAEISSCPGVATATLQCDTQALFRNEFLI
jgi:hypothetical protein